MTRLRLLLASTATAALAAGLLPVGAASSASPDASGDSGLVDRDERLLPGGLEYVALGDSWTANVVLVNRDGAPDSTYAPIDCAQSYVNYPKLLAEALSVGGVP